MLSSRWQVLNSSLRASHITGQRSVLTPLCWPYEELSSGACDKSGALHDQDYEEILCRRQQGTTCMQYAHCAKAIFTGECSKYSPVCLHADNTLDADSSVGLTSGYGGDTYDAAWVQDPDVGVVIECNKVCLLLRSCTSCEVPWAGLCDSLKLPSAAGRQSRNVLWAVPHASVFVRL